MHDDNPYAAPQTDLTLGQIPLASDSQGSGIIRWEGEQLVVTSPCELPAGCIYCNAEVQKNKLTKMTLNYSPRWMLLLLLLGLLPYLIGVLIVRNVCEIKFGLCKTHYKKTLLNQSLGIFLILFGFGISYWGIQQSFGTGIYPFYIYIGLAILTIGAIWLAIAFQRIIITKHVKGVFWLSCFGPEFIQRNRFEKHS